MQPFITKVTVTGADDTTPIDAIRHIAEKYPFVEFGILLSKGSMGRPRFPSAGWLQKFCDAYHGQGISFAGHVCGSWVRQFLNGNWPKWDLYEIHPHLLEMFQRYQINTHAITHTVNLKQLPFILREFASDNRTIIFQCDGINGELIIDRMHQAGCTNIAGLFDLSHGTGILPAKWPSPLLMAESGYAGGLSPENVVEQIEKIASTIGERQIWIDAETHLRSVRYPFCDAPPTDIFDLNKVQDFLEAAKPWVIQPTKGGHQ